MRICDRCKGNKATTLKDLKDGTEYDLCPACLEDFQNTFLTQKLSLPKKKAVKKEDDDASK